MVVAEYHAEAGTAFLLQVTIKLPSHDAAVDLRMRLHASERKFEIIAGSNFCLLVVQTAPSVALDDQLEKIANEIDQINNLAGKISQVELLESRLVPVDSSDSIKFSEQYGLVLDSGNAFGTGQHPSTRLALRALSEVMMIETMFPGKVLDVGCGSGILALSSARAGASHVLGIDISPEAVAVARRNVLANGLAERIEISDQLFDQITANFDLITANLTASVLMRLAPQFVDRLSHRGLLIVAGIQGRQADEVTAILAPLGFVVLKIYESGPWRSLLYRLFHF